MEENIRERGITLVSLAVTVIVLMILAGIIVNTNSGRNAIFNVANNKKEETEKMTIEESIKMDLEENSPKNYDELIEFLKNYGEIKNENLPDEAVLITTEGSYQILIKDLWNIDKQEIGVSIGDYIEYKYDGGTYNINGENSGTNQLQTITDTTTDASIWRVVDVNKQNNQIKIIPTTLNNYTVTLKGAEGFNNGVKILNDICNKIFCNTDYNTTAKNISIKDLEKISSNVSELRGTNYGIEKKYTSLVYPDVIKNENDSSMQNGFFSGTSSSNNISLIQNYYTGNIVYTNEIYQNIISKGNYWISSRAINNNNSNAEYYLRNLKIENTSNLSGTKLFDSNGQAGSGTFNLLPVVTLKDITFLEGNGSKESPYKFIK